MKEVEYIFSVSSKCTVCKSKAKLKSFLDASDLSLVKDVLSFESEQSKIKILEKKTKDSEGIVYSITFSSDSDDEPIKLLKMFRQIICSIKDGNKKNVAILELRNDFAKSRSEKLYSNIYTLENSIRKLISKFMLETLGMKWYEATPQDVKNTVKGEYKWNNDCLYHLDFIQLSYFLTIPYADKSGNIVDELKKCIDKEITEEEKKKLRLFIPKNNWDRYFNALVDYDSEKFKSNWEKLYEYRCDIAHNRIISQNEYDECLKKCNEMQKIIDDAIRKIDTVEITEEEKKNTAERTIDEVGLSLKASIIPEGILDTFSTVRELTAPIKSVADIIQSMKIPDYNALSGMSALSKCFPEAKSVATLNSVGEKFMKSCFVNNENITRLGEKFRPYVDSIGKNNSVASSNIVNAIDIIEKNKQE